MFHAAFCALIIVKVAKSVTTDEHTNNNSLHVASVVPECAMYIGLTQSRPITGL